MTRELLQAVRQEVLSSSGPVTASQVARSIPVEGKSPSSKQVKEALRQLTEIEHGLERIYSWKRYRASEVFSREPLTSAVESAFLQILEQEPFTIPKAASAIRGILRLVSEEQVSSVLRSIAKPLLSSGKIHHYAVTRQSVLYFSSTWASSLTGGEGNEDSLLHLLTGAVERLQPSEGSFVSIAELRHSSEVRHLLDETILQLAQSRRLILTRYDGPKTVSEEEKWQYVEAADGELFVGVALGRSEET